MLCQQQEAFDLHVLTQTYGVHINGYVDEANGLEMWIGRRSKSKQTWPSKLDHIVAGGQVNHGPRHASTSTNGLHAD